MRARYWALVLGCVVLFIAQPKAEQAGRPSEKQSAKAPYTQPRTPDGQPDLRGWWHIVPFGTISIEASTNPVAGATNTFGDPFQSQAAAATSIVENPSISRIVDPPDGKIPYQPWAAAKANDIHDHYNDPKPHQLDPQSRCYLQGIPRAMYQSASVIIQTAGEIVILHDFAHSYRVIPLDNRPRLPESMKLFMGDARGRWDGNTLVIETTNLNDIPWFAVSGSFHSDALRVTERLTRIDNDTIEYLALIDDHKMYTRPWTMRFAMKRNTDPKAEQWEEACYEGNHSVEFQLGHPDKQD